MKTYDLSHIQPLMLSWRHQIHRHPETAYREYNTSKLVASILTDLGLEVYEGIAETGVVAVLKSTKKNTQKSIALRADMDALDIQELNQFDHRSRLKGKMHACGHDGHTAMLLGAASYLAQSPDLVEGTVYFIFQPAEENEGGGRRMVDEGLFERFPADAVFGMHNMPSLAIGKFSLCPGPMMAAFSTFECVVKGIGTHSSIPHMGINPITVGTEIISAWQDFRATTFSIDAPVNLSVTRFHSGETWNVIPETAVIGGSTRCFSLEVGAQLKDAMSTIAKETCLNFNTTCEFNYRFLYPPLVNAPEQTTFAADVASSLVGEEFITRDMPPVLGSEDFAYMLQAKPGAYILIGNGIGEQGGCMVHNAHYDFNDDILALGASYWISLVEHYFS